MTAYRSPWQASIAMLRSIPKQRTIARPAFKAATPDQVVKWFKNQRGAATCDSVMAGMNLSKSTAQRLLNLLAEEARLILDKDSHPKHYLYRLPEAE